MDNVRYNMPAEAIIVKNSVSRFFSDATDIYSYYSSYAIYARFFRKIARGLGLYLVYPIFYGRWKKRLADVKVVILFDTGIEDVSKVTKYIKKINPKLKIVFWYWNPVKYDDIALSDRNIDEIWTYSRFDAKEYGLKYSPQFYRRLPLNGSADLDMDLVFLGKNKGREQTLMSLREDAENKGLRCDFVLTEKNDALKYEEYLHRVFKSKCIVDLVSDQKCGMTLRPLEALFYKKKLITNYKDIVNYDFYNKENIFLIGRDDVAKLVEFVNGSYEEIDQKIVDFYSYESWLERIKKGEDVRL